MTHGAGSVYQRSRDDRWVADVALPTERGEKRRRMTRVFHTEAEAQAWLLDYRASTPAPEQVDRATGRARAIALDGRGHTEEEWYALNRAAGPSCHYCGVTTTLAVGRTHPRHRERDHRTPLCRGGSDLIENIVVCCRACNTSKGKLTEAEFMKWRANG